MEPFEQPERRCFIVVGEWEFGIQNAQGQKRREQIRAAGEPIFVTMKAIWESNPTVAYEYGIVYAQLRPAGQIIPTNDIWIAAVARVYNAVVVTSDPHFRRIAGLLVEDWTQP